MMNPPRALRTALALFLAWSIACPPAWALVALNDGRDRIFVTGTFGVSHDSNVFANSDNEGDFVYSSGFVAEYVRRAGWIGVNGSMAVTGSRFGQNTDQNFSNPRYSL